MSVTLVSGEYTAINTNENEYVLQNKSPSYSFELKVAATQPADSTVGDFIIEPRCGFSHNHIAGLCWGKPINTEHTIIVGLSEG